MPALLVFLSQGLLGKVLITTFIFTLMAVVVPMAIALVDPFIGITGILSNLGAYMPQGAGFWASLIQLHIGIPLMLSAVVARFLIRRLPVIG